MPSADSPILQPWPRLSSRPRGSFKVFDVREDERQSPTTGGRHTFYVIESSDWVNIIPVTPEGKLVFVRQVRHATEEVTLEVPGGMVDAEDGSPAVAGRREMQEETGYDTDDIVALGAVAPNPAILNNRCHTFLARDARPLAQQHLDGAEEIRVELVDPDDVPGLIAGGQISHSLVICAFYLYDYYRRQNGLAG